MKIERLTLWYNSGAAGHPGPSAPMHRAIW